MAPLSLSHVSKYFGSLAVVDDVKVDIADGEFAVLVGPSGCGKSTMLRMVAGLEHPTHGEIRIGDRVVNDDEPARRDIAMVFQNYALYPHMSVARNIGFGLRMAGVDKSEIARRIASVAKTLNLEHLLDRKPRELSGGQRQRVAMGRAIVRDPKVFLFDEPLSNLDAQLRVHMRVEIRELQQRLGTTTIYVTHDQVEAMTMADRIVVMNAGRVEQAGRPLDIYDRPANRFVAGFIGSPSMNLIEGSVSRSSTQPVFRSAAGDLELPLPESALLGDGRKIVYGIRPEHLTVTEDGAQARVGVAESTGYETQIQARAGATALMLVQRERSPLRVGDPIGLRPDLERLHIFDGATGARIELFA